MSFSCPFPKALSAYVLRDMTSEHGAFFSAEDADSEGVEGKFYVWRPEEVKNVLGNEDGELFCKTYDINHKENFEGASIPNLIDSSIDESKKDFFANCRKKLFMHREKRIHPHKDDKILTAWNGLMIAALATGGRVLKCNEYTEAAKKAAAFILKNLVDENGRLLARYRDGDAACKAYIDDYAFLAWGLIELYQATFEPEYLEKALKLTEDSINLFWDHTGKGFFLYGNDSEELIIRPKEIYDGAMPSGNSVSAMNLIKLARLTGKYNLEEYAEDIFKAFSGSISLAPASHSFALCAYMFMRHPAKELVIAGTKDKHDTETMIDAIREGYKPFNNSLYYSQMYPELVKLVPFIENYKPIDGKTTVYICENFACMAPITDPDILRQQL